MIKQITVIASMIILLLLIGGIYMSYTPTTWTDEVLSSSPPLFNISGSSGSPMIYPNVRIDLATSGSAGTPVNAANLNKLELGLQAAAATADSGGALATTFTTAGDMLIGSGSGSAIRLPVGSDYQILQARAGAAEKMEWSDVIGCSLYVVNSNSFATDTWTKINNFTVSDEIYDSNNFHDASVNPGRIVIPQELSGWYIVTATAYFGAPDATAFMRIDGYLPNFTGTTQSWEVSTDLLANKRTLTQLVYSAGNGVHEEYIELLGKHINYPGTASFSFVSLTAIKLR